jgi:hypothetical protein
MASLGRRG